MKNVIFYLRCFGLVLLNCSLLEKDRATAQVPYIFPSENLKDITLPPSYSFTYNARVRGGQKYIQWYKDDMVLVNQTNNYLSIQNNNNGFNKSVLGEYYFIASNSFGAVTSRVSNVYDRVQWKNEDGGNGHYYSVIFKEKVGMTWTEAYNYALDLGGHLATVTTPAENRWCFGLIDLIEYWWRDYGPYIGINRISIDRYRPENGWQWITGEKSDFYNWIAGNPDNYSMVENYGQYIGQGNRTEQWNDVGDSAKAYPNAGFLVLSGLVEFPEELTIIQRPLDVVYTNQLQLRLSVAAVSKNPISYQWMRSSVPIPEATNRYFNVPNPNQEKGVKYQVRVSDGVSVVETDSVQILFPPKIKISITSNKLNVNLEVDGDFQSSIAIESSINLIDWVEVLRLGRISGLSTVALHVDNIEDKGSKYWRVKTY